MACGCTGHTGAAQTEKPQEQRKQEPRQETLPTTQCPACLQKHLDEAWTLFHEYGYADEDRRFIRGNLRAMVLHSYKRWPEIADLSRQIALLVQDARDAEAAGLFPRLCEMVDSAFYEARPEVAERLETLRRRTDVIIPLGEGSRSNDDELRILLRSLERHALDLGRVYVVTDNPPAWLDADAAVVVPCADRHEHNKDANLIDKTLTVIRRYGLRSFCWAADDNVLLQDMRLADIPVTVNRRRREDYSLGTTWQRRVLHTFDWAASRGVKLEHSHEAHCPQHFADAQAILDGMKGVDYATLPGLTIMTAFRVVAGEADKATAMQQDIKFTVEVPYDAAAGLPGDKMFLGYNDTGFFSGLRETLFERFPAPSRFERESAK